MRRVAIAYDGFNYYYGLRKLLLRTGLCLYWQDLPALSQDIAAARPGHEPADQVVQIAYFTADIKSSDPKKVGRQQHYFQLLEAQGVVKLIKGEYNIKPIRCHVCDAEPAFCSCGAQLEKHQEKQTDVNLAIWAVIEAGHNGFDDLVIVTSDNDLKPAAQTVRKFKDKRVFFCFPPEQLQISSLKHSANGWCEITQTMLQANLMRWNVEFMGNRFRCPESWRLGYIGPN